MVAIFGAEETVAKIQVRLTKISQGKEIIQLSPEKKEKDKF